MKYNQGIEHVFQLKSRQSRTLESNPLVPVYRVGEVFRQGRRSWPVGSYFTYSPGGHELTLFRSSIGEDMVNQVSRGQAEFAMIVEPPLFFFAYRFGQSIPWGDAPYSWHLQPAEWRALPPANHPRGARALIWVSLVGADDGIIHAQRGMTLSPGFTHVLHAAIRNQALMAFDAHACVSALARICNDHSTTVDRLSLAVVRTLGNE